MNGENTWYVRMEDGKVYGPANLAALVEWSKDGRIEPTSFVSRDRKSWQPAQTKPELEMKWLIEVEPGKVFGPFHRAVVSGLFRNGGVGKAAKAYRLHEFAIDEDPPPVEKIVEKEVIKEVRVEVPVEKIVEKEVIKEVRVEVPVEKIVEKVVEVPPPARTELVVAEVLEPVAAKPPPMRSDSIFGDLGHSGLAALEAAARRELVTANRKGHAFGLCGSKRK